MAATNPIKILFGRLNDAGVDGRFVRSHILPSWWKESLADSQPGFAYTLSIISSHLNIPLSALADNAKPLFIPQGPHARFKLYKNVTAEDVSWANSVALAAARLVIEAMPARLRPIGGSPTDIRDRILAKGEPCVSLGALLDYLWGRGIPVIHVSAKPKGQKKMAGLAARVGDRPVIVCSKNDSLSALMLFLVAHEFGHVVTHLGNDEFVVDEKLEGAETIDAEEKAANLFAARLLTGSSAVYSRQDGQALTSKRLALVAKTAGRRDRVDPGVVAMSYAHGRQFYPVGVGACRILEGDHADAPEIIRVKMREHLDLKLLSEEDQEFVIKACGIGVPNALPVGH